jgi:hypothetical protein
MEAIRKAAGIRRDGRSSAFAASKSIGINAALAAKYPSLAR